MHEGVKSLHLVFGPDVTNPQGETLSVWAAILKINYWPIFAIAKDILEQIPGNTAASILRELLDTAQGVESTFVFDRYCQGHQLELYVMIRVPIARITVGGIVLGAVVSACDRTPPQGTQTADPTGVESPSIPATPAPLTKASILPDYVVLKPGESRQFTFEAVDANGKAITNLEPEWTTSVDGGAISPSGLLTAGTRVGVFSEGVVAIAGTAGVFVETAATVAVEPDPMYRVMIIPDQQLFYTNGSFDFRIEAYDAYDNAIPNIEVSWSSKDGQITRDGHFSTGTEPAKYEIVATVSDGETSLKASRIVHTVDLSIPHDIEVAPRGRYAGSFRTVSTFPFAGIVHDFLGEKRAGDACVTPEGRQGTLKVRRDDLPFVVPTRLDEAHLPIPRAVVLECEELRPPFAPGVLLDVRPVKTGGSVWRSPTSRRPLRSSPGRATSWSWLILSPEVIPTWPPPRCGRMPL